MIALAISVAAHLLLLILYRPLALVSLTPADADLKAQSLEPFVFDLVETPDDAIRRKPDEAKSVSDRDALARNEVDREELPEGEAYSEGVSEYRIFQGGFPVRSDGDPAENSGRQLSAERGKDDQAPRPEDKNASDVAEHVRGDLGEIFRSSRISSREGGSGEKDRGRGPFTDGIDYDQRNESARDLGGITLNTYNWAYASYILEMKRKLRSNTHPPGAFSPLGLIDGQTVLSFKVMPDGRVTDLAVIEYTGDRTLMETSVDAVQNSSPFRPLPEDFPMEYLELTWTFIFYVYGRQHGTYQ